MTMWQPIETAKRESAKDVLLWHGRMNVGSWFDQWEYDWRHPEAKHGGGWVINGGYVVEPTMWAPIEAPRIHGEQALQKSED